MTTNRSQNQKSAIPILSNFARTIISNRYNFTKTSSSSRQQQSDALKKQHLKQQQQQQQQQSYRQPQQHPYRQQQQQSLNIQGQYSQQPCKQQTLNLKSPSTSEQRLRQLRNRIRQQEMKIHVKKTILASLVENRETLEKDLQQFNNIFIKVKSQEPVQRMEAELMHELGIDLLRDCHSCKLLLQLQPECCNISKINCMIFDHYDNKIRLSSIPRFYKFDKHKDAEIIRCLKNDDIPSFLSLLQS